MPWWTVSKPALENGVTYVSNAYKNEDDKKKNKLTTISPANPTGYILIDPNSNDAIVKGTSYAVQTDGKITYKVDFNTYTTQFNSIQEIANFGYTGYSPGTTAKIKNEMQYVLSTSAKRQGVGPSTAQTTKPAADKPAAAAAAGGDPGAAADKQPPPSAASAVSEVTGTKSLSPIPLPKDLGTVGESYIKYPIDMRSSQDRIVFTAMEIAKVVKSDSNKITLPKSGFSMAYTPVKEGLKTVVLPIQPSISDSNSVDWGSGELNAIYATAARLSLGAMESKSQYDLQTAITDAIGVFTNRPDGVGNLVKTWAAENAVGVQNLLSRVTGSVLNPNLELLFNGPALRPFSFTFKLSPRSEKEAVVVRRIIRFFKQNMAVRKTDDTELFVKSPYVFRIVYNHGDVTDKFHKSINRIKTCALQSFNVDYTPLNSYMTYEDDAATMVSYNISLQFTEIEPVYSTDYEKNMESDEIGY
jgi:hypothetical protein